MVAPTLLEVRKLGCVRGDRRLFSGLDLSLPAGTFLQVTGPNGSGKTSLLRILCRLLAPAEGEIKWQGENIRSLGEEYFTSVTYLGHRHGVKDELSGIENLRISNALNGIEISKERARASSNAWASRDVNHFRHGSCRKVRDDEWHWRVFLLAGRKLWLLDEVMTSLDKGAVALIRSLIEEHLAGGGIAIVATHQDLELTTGSSQRLELAT